MNTAKEKYKNIIFITATTSEYDFLQLHFENQELIDRASQGDLIVFVYGSENIKDAKMSKTEGYENIRDLIIPYKESYITLSEKTFKSIKYFCENFDFDFLYKGDVTKHIEVSAMDLDHKKRKDYLGISAIKPRKNKWGGFTYESLVTEHTGCPRRVFRRWAEKRNLTVDAWSFDDAVYYSGWKPYGMSKKFAKLISKYGENYNRLYVEKFAGCEDHMIGKIWRDLQVAYELTMR